MQPDSMGGAAAGAAPAGAQAETPTTTGWTVTHSRPLPQVCTPGPAGRAVAASAVHAAATTRPEASSAAGSSRGRRVPTGREDMRPLSPIPAGLAHLPAGQPAR